MKYIYLFALLIFGCLVHAQDSIKVVRSGSMSDFNIMSSQKDNSINFEFAPLSEETKLSIDIYRVSESNDIELLNHILAESLNKKEKAKIYTSIEQSKKDVHVKNTLIGNLITVFPVKATSEEKISIFPFKPRPNEQNKTVPIVLLMDIKNEAIQEVMGTIIKILNCQQLEDIKEDDIDFLRKRSNTIRIITYKLDAVK